MLMPASCVRHVRTGSSSGRSQITRRQKRGINISHTSSSHSWYQGIKSTNAVHTQDRDTEGSILYYTYSLINHSCYSNTRSDIQSDGFKMKVYAQRAIAKGEEVCYIMFDM